MQRGCCLQAAHWRLPWAGRQSGQVRSGQEQAGRGHSRKLAAGTEGLAAAVDACSRHSAVWVSGLQHAAHTPAASNSLGTCAASGRAVPCPTASPTHLRSAPAPAPLPPAALAWAPPPAPLPPHERYRQCAEPPGGDRSLAAAADAEPAAQRRCLLMPKLAQPCCDVCGQLYPGAAGSGAASSPAAEGRHLAAGVRAEVDTRAGHSCSPPQAW